jgi:cytochrome c oxidase subunit 2
LFAAKSCNTCHRPDSAARAPLLHGIFGKSVALSDGRSATADEGYLRESIMDPRARVVAGYEPIMPTYRGQLSEEEILELIGYLQTLRAPASQEGAL